MIKKLLMILSGIIGLLFMLIGLLLLAVEIYVSWVMLQKGYTINEYICVCLIAILVIYIGWRLLRIKKTIFYIDKIKYYIKNREQISLEKQRIRYQKELKRHEEALEIGEQITNERRMVIIEGEEINDKQKRWKFANKQKGIKKQYIDTPLKNQRQEIRIHLCAGTDIIWKVICSIGVSMIVGSLVSIPIVCSVVASESIGIYACITTVVFWSGILLVVGVKGHLDGDTNVVFVTTNQSLLYKLDLNALFAPMTDAPVTKVGQIIYYHQKGKENDAIQKTINSFLKDRKVAEEVIDELINPSSKEKSKLVLALKKLNSPVLKKKISGTYIKYWDENKEKWLLVFLPKKTEEYTMICDLVNSRNFDLF